jgi:hypothetical protein
MMMQELQMMMQELQMELELNHNHLHQMQEHKAAPDAGKCEPSKFPWCPDLGATAQNHIEVQRQHE